MFRKAIRVTLRFCIQPWRLFRSSQTASPTESVSQPLFQLTLQSPELPDITPEQEISTTSDSSSCHDSRAAQVSNRIAYPYHELAELREADQPIDIVEFVNSRDRYPSESTGMIDTAYADVRLQLAVEGLMIMNANDSIVTDNEPVVVCDDAVINYGTRIEEEGEQEEVAMNSIVAPGSASTADTKVTVQPARNLMYRLCSLFH
ncbi:hypothetical protein V1507DRAFT_169896 [Lipomyces tetrasporus]